MAEKSKSALPIPIKDLLHQDSIESIRVEFKASWNSNTTGLQVLKTICAFANDFQNLNGGYIVIGVDESEGRPVLPARGLAIKDLENAQSWIRGQCKATMPGYMPLFVPETVGDRNVLAVWAPASEYRPHRVPNRHRNLKYWIRSGSETVDAEANGLLNALVERASSVPWDNQVAIDADIKDLNGALVLQHLRNINSKLQDYSDTTAIYRGMRITDRVNGHERPRNVGLLFFSDDPDNWFPGARIVVVQFAADRSGRVQDEHEFKGPLTTQLRNCLRYLQGLLQKHVRKEVDGFETSGWASYPLPALREALVNAVFHRSYRQDVLEPTKVCLYPDRMEIISYPGPVAGVERAQFLPSANIPQNPAPARNPRVGEFLKQLKLAEGWQTGLPNIHSTMSDNGSPNPKFDFDERRQWFRTTLPAHPEYAAVLALQHAAYLRAVGSADDAYNRVRDAWEANDSSALLAEEMIRLCAERDDLNTAEAVFDRFRHNGTKAHLGQVAGRWVEVLTRNGRVIDARKVLDEFPEILESQNTVQSGILARRLRKPQTAHQYFERAGDAIRSDVRALVEFARTKITLAQVARNGKKSDWQIVNQRLLLEARELLERAIQIDASPVRHAMAWRELGVTLSLLNAPKVDVKNAFENAKKLSSDEYMLPLDLY